MHPPDAYTWKARIAPVLIVTAPVAVYSATAVALTVKLAVGSAVIGAAVLVLLSQLGRDSGKRLEPELFERWGGRPTERLLSWEIDDPTVVAQRHADVASATHLNLPTAAEELDNPVAARERYSQAIAALREETRNTDFPLVEAENVNYGFRRNLLGLRSAGVVACLLVMAASVITYLVHDDDTNRLAACGVPFLFALALVVILIAVVRRDWPKTPAIGYAEQLVAAAGTLRRRRKSQIVDPA
ncbi:MAG TPA: hypothetical protein VI299_27960 [Polyangiales bacterium]